MCHSKTDNKQPAEVAPFMVKGGPGERADDNVHDDLTTTETAVLDALRIARRRETDFAFDWKCEADRLVQLLAGQIEDGKTVEQMSFAWNPEHFAVLHTAAVALVESRRVWVEWHTGCHQRRQAREAAKGNGAVK